MTVPSTPGRRSSIRHAQGLPLTTHPGQAGYAQAVGDLVKSILGNARMRWRPGQATCLLRRATRSRWRTCWPACWQGLPTVSPTYDGVTVNPAVATLGTAGAMAGGYSPLSSGQSAAAAMLQNVGGISGSPGSVRFSYDLEGQRVRADRIHSGLTSEGAAYCREQRGRELQRTALSAEQRGDSSQTPSRRQARVPWTRCWRRWRQARPVRGQPGRRRRSSRAFPPRPRRRTTTSRRSRSARRRTTFG